MSRILLHFFLFFLVGCGSKSLEGYHDKGAKIIAEIIEELDAVETRDRLIEAAPRLKQLFLTLSKTIIAAHEYQEKNPHLEPLEMLQSDHQRSDHLRQQLQRIYQIEGCREVLEKCQQDALNLLDGYQQKTRTKLR
jgi:hypothetical protein